MNWTKTEIHPDQHANKNEVHTGAKLMFQTERTHEPKTPLRKRSNHSDTLRNNEREEKEPPKKIAKLNDDMGNTNNDRENKCILDCISDHNLDNCPQMLKYMEISRKLRSHKRCLKCGGEHYIKACRQRAPQ